MKKYYYLLATLAFVLSLYLITKGHTISGGLGLRMMFIGLAGLLLNLYFYNRKHI